MATFRTYSVKEVRDAAQAYGVDPDFFEAVYAVESSRGTNPKALEPRTVKRKRDSTIVRGPFQLEDDTTSDLLKKHGMQGANVDDPDVHLDLALRLVKDLKERYNGDYGKVAQAYLGFGTDELGTTDRAYRNKIMAEMKKLKGNKEVTPEIGLPTLPKPEGMGLPSLDEIAPYHAADASADDLFGYTSEVAARPPMSDTSTWRDLVAANSAQDAFSSPTPRMAEITPDSQMHDYLNLLVNEEFDGREFTNA